MTSARSVPSSGTLHAGEAARSTPLWSGLALGLLVYGLVVRAVQYAYGNSLWFDEARNAVEILKPSWLEMLPPHVEQPTPVGFFALERLVVAALGEQERSPAVSVNTATGEIEES